MADEIETGQQGAGIDETEDSCAVRPVPGSSSSTLELSKVTRSESFTRTELNHNKGGDAVFATSRDCEQGHVCC